MCDLDDVAGRQVSSFQKYGWRDAPMLGQKYTDLSALACRLICEDYEIGRYRSASGSFDRDQEIEKLTRVIARQQELLHCEARERESLLSTLQLRDQHARSLEAEISELRIEKADVSSFPAPLFIDDRVRMLELENVDLYTRIEAKTKQLVLAEAHIGVQAETLVQARQRIHELAKTAELFRNSGDDFTSRLNTQLKRLQHLEDEKVTLCRTIETQNAALQVSRIPAFEEQVARRDNDVKELQDQLRDLNQKMTETVRRNSELDRQLQDAVLVKDRTDLVQN